MPTSSREDFVNGLLELHDRAADNWRAFNRNC